MRRILAPTILGVVLACGPALVPISTTPTPSTSLSTAPGSTTDPPSASSAPSTTVLVPATWPIWQRFERPERLGSGFAQAQDLVGSEEELLSCRGSGSSAVDRYHIGEFGISVLSGELPATGGGDFDSDEDERPDVLSEPSGSWPSRFGLERA